MTLITAPNPILDTPTTLVEDLEAAKEVDFLLKLELRLAQGGLVGLAANQIGRSERMCYIQLNDGTWLLMINPLVEATYGLAVYDYEGCGSLPGIKVNVPRPPVIEVSFEDLKGDEYEIRLEGFEARVALHEIDHLDGILITKYGPKEAI